MRFRPCVDLHKGKVKQIVGSTYSDSNTENLITNFETEQSPEYFSRLYREENLYGGHLIMIGQGNENAAKKALLAFPQGFQIGGGITLENAIDFLDAGASHVIVSSYIFKHGPVNWDNLSKLVEKIGKQRLVLDISCKIKDEKYYIVTDRWQKFTSIALSEKNLEQLSLYCDEFLVHAVDIEGLQQGVDKNLVSLLGELSSISVTYAGGIKSLNDLDEIYRYGKSRVDATVGSALDIFGGELKYKDVVAWHRKHCV